MNISLLGLGQFIVGANYLKQTPEIIDELLKYFEKKQLNDSVILNRV